MFRTFMLALSAVLLTACASSATPSPDPVIARTEAPAAHELLDRMVGRCVLTGEIAGQATQDGRDDVFGLVTLNRR